MSPPQPPPPPYLLDLALDPPPALIAPAPDAIQAAIAQKRPVTRWTRQPFTAQPDALVLHHWSSEQTIEDMDTDTLTASPFTVFDRAIDVVEWTAADYEALLSPLDPDWDHADTAHLFALVRQFDARFPVVHDRYAPAPSGIERDLESLQERYVAVTRALLMHRHQHSAERTQQLAASLTYSASADRDRKAHVEALMGRSADEIAREVAAHAVLELFNADMSAVVRDRHEVLARAYKGHSPGELAAWNTNRAKAREQYQSTVSASDQGSLAIPATVHAAVIHHPETPLAPGVYLRSSLLPKLVPHHSNIKANSTMGRLGHRPSDHVVHNTPLIHKTFTDLRTVCVQLSELSKLVTKSEQELKTLAVRAGYMPAVLTRPPVVIGDGKRHGVVGSPAPVPIPTTTAATVGRVKGRR
ncbi:hypothetical protein BC828DRAFT_373330 [Blastocladiella britannica]|nr:hypothetical protein BC828DRAFT_373330 [Blastocladiella britannica]